MKFNVYRLARSRILRGKVNSTLDGGTPVSACLFGKSPYYIKITINNFRSKDFRKFSTPDQEDILDGILYVN